VIHMEGLDADLDQIQNTITVSREGEGEEGGTKAIITTCRTSGGRRRGLCAG
jgi:hypothetical protein